MIDEICLSIKEKDKIFHTKDIKKEECEEQIMKQKQKEEVEEKS